MSISSAAIVFPDPLTPGRLGRSVSGYLGRWRDSAFGRGKPML